MPRMKTIYEYTQTNILVLPQALFAMKDVSVLMQSGDAVVFRKQLEQDLSDIEFYTNQPCLIYIESGRETLTNSDNGTTELFPGSAIFLAQGLNLHSDFVKSTESLKAYLVFFDEQAILEYLKKVKSDDLVSNTDQGFCLLEEKDNGLANFFSTIQSDIKSSSYLDIKLQELLHLVAYMGNKNLIHALLAQKAISNKRNLRRLLESEDILHLTVSDLAQLSGRSISSFNRDFKNIYNVTPQKWLRDKRMVRANTLLERGAISVTDAALEVGYDNVSNFIRVFKLKYGKTPNQIKKAR
ncbi:AraC family transcriptional regulator [Enterovibrio norvegicus FF-162]|uniref:AraC family transcriptional regulator n=1 Tax=Enterovibrio norvegicus TaxID=188144 RepID=UPI0002F98E29|nr:AraC family transcriptional regulator [Enterovibrio norvegicus]OEE74055.1 AraC family transcriptional regulator [Enterovibrio norvegicus FF-162]